MSDDAYLTWLENAKETCALDMCEEPLIAEQVAELLGVSRQTIGLAEDEAKGKLKTQLDWP